MEGASSVFCSSSQIPNKKSSLLNCQDCITVGKVQCFDPTHVCLCGTGFLGDFAALTRISNSGF